MDLSLSLHLPSELTELQRDIKLASSEKQEFYD